MFLKRHKTEAARFPGSVQLPSFCDVHVHFRQPGFEYKETIKTGCLAAARGGYTAVCAMPNLKPVPDCKENLARELEVIQSDACIDVFPYGAITKGEQGQVLSDMKSIAAGVVAFSDDGRGVQSDAIMREAMTEAHKLGKIIVAHCELNSLLCGGYIHAGTYAKEHGHKGICSESEWQQVERDLALAKETGCAYHVCHISCRKTVELVRRAKADGVDVTCEVTPHHLLLDENSLQDDGRFKMNPPLRTGDDRTALIEGICDRTIDIVATDHAPHSADEKSRGLAGSAMGIVGLETAFPLLYTNLVKTGIITLKRLVNLMAHNPRARFGIAQARDYAVWDLDKEYRINSADFLSMGRSTPFEGCTVFGKCLKTVHNGKTVYESKR